MHHCTLCPRVFRRRSGLLCCALVLTIVAPWGGNWWYLLSGLSPLAGGYYYDRADRVEQVNAQPSLSRCVKVAYVHGLIWRQQSHVRALWAHLDASEPHTPT